MTTRATKTRARKARLRASVQFAKMPLRAECKIYPRGRWTALGYKAAEYSRSDGVNTAADGNEIANYRWDRYEIIKRSRQLYRDTAIYKGVIDRAVDFIIGRNGFALQARTSSKRLNQYLEFLWRQEFARYPEVRGEFDFYELQRSICLQTILDGDVGLLKVKMPYGGRLQVIDSMRIGGYNFTAGAGYDSGVVLDKYGRPEKFTVYDYSDYGYIEGGSGRNYSARDFLFIANLQFLSNVRGIPALVSSFPLVHMLDDILSAETSAWQVLSRFALSIEREGAAELSKVLSEDDPKGLENPSLTTKVQEFEKAIVFHTEPGGKIRGIDRNLPGVQLEPATRLFIRLMALPLGMPFELAMLDWSKTNYSSARASLEVAYQNFSRWQNLLKRRFFERVYRWKVRDWLARGLIEDRNDLLNHDWIAPEFPWIDQLKETQAWGERIDRGLATWGMAARAAGVDPEELMAERGAEINRAIVVANKLNEQYPNANVDWRVLVGLEPRSTGGPEPTGDVEGDKENGEGGDG